VPIQVSLLFGWPVVAGSIPAAQPDEPSEIRGLALTRISLALVRATFLAALICPSCPAARQKIFRLVIR